MNQFFLAWLNGTLSEANLTIIGICCEHPKNAPFGDLCRPKYIQYKQLILMLLNLKATRGSNSEILYTCTYLQFSFFIKIYNVHDGVVA